jgi:hypothetical protein
MSAKLTKYFGVLSITSLVGLVASSAAGCSDGISVLQALADAGPGGSTKDAKSSTPTGTSSGEPDPDPDPTPGKKDASTEEEEDGGLVIPKKDSGADSGPILPPPGSCLDTTPINATLFPYTKAGVTANACTNTELANLSAYFKTKSDLGQDVVISQWSTVVGASCAKCVFGASTGTTTWTPILTAADQLEAVNRGGCIEVKSGKESCGRAYQQATDCRLEACLTICQTQAEFTSCLQQGAAIFTGPCKHAYDKMDLECGANLATYETGCKGTSWTFEGPIKVQCIDGN